MLAKAIAMAAVGHEKQKDKGKKPYILHPLRMMFRLRTEDEELMQIAVMHDLIEDTSITLSELIVKGFSQRVVDALEVLTHDPKVPYEVYITDISKNKDAVKIKLEDLKDNSDITRLKGVTPKDVTRMQKYNNAYVFLKETERSHGD